MMQFIKSIRAGMVLLVAALAGCGGGGSEKTEGVGSLAGRVSLPGGGSLQGIAVVAERVTNGLTATVGQAVASQGRSDLTAAVEGKYTTLTDNSGSYRFTGLPAGQYTVMAQQVGGAAAVQTGVMVRSRQTTIVNLQLTPVGKIRGTVTVGGAGKGFVIVALPGTSYLAITDSGGTYEISSVPVGTYRVSAIDPGSGATAEVSGVAVAAGQTTDHVDLAIAPGPRPDPKAQQEFQRLLSQEQSGATAVGSEACATCHRRTGSRQVDWEAWLETEHAERGVGCEQCHGPGSKHVASPDEDNILTFPNITHGIVCGQCHTDTYQEWTFSKHDEITEAPVEETATNPALYGRSSRCVACHSGLFRTEIVEKGVDVATMPDEKIVEVAEHTLNHVPFTASCATCHDPHRQTGNLTDDGEEAQLRHATTNTDTTPIAPGTVAAQFTTYNHICAQCHNGRGANPSDDALQRGTSRPNMHDSPQFNMLMGVGGWEGSGPIVRNMAHATMLGQCSYCHMPDSRHTFTVSYDRGCAPCHTATDAAARVTAVKGEIQAALFGLRSRLDRWAQQTYQGNPDYASVDPRLIPALWDYSALLNTRATELGVTITLPSTHQANIPMEVKRARHNYYFILRDKCFGPHNPPYARHLLTVANQQLDALGVGRAAPSRAGRQVLAVLEGDLRRLKEVDRHGE